VDYFEYPETELTRNDLADGSMTANYQSRLVQSHAVARNDDGKMNKTTKSFLATPNQPRTPCAAPSCTRGLACRGIGLGLCIGTEINLAQDGVEHVEPGVLHVREQPDQQRADVPELRP
jgi:hypothetical protein